MARTFPPRTAAVAHYDFFHREPVAEGPTTGNAFYVHAGTGSDSAGAGRSPEAPFASLDYAFGSHLAASNGDRVYLLPGHTETYTTTGTKFTGDVAGVRVIGLGHGSQRPTFTFSHTGAKFDITANGVTLENILFVTGIDSVVTFATISGADCSIINCETRDTTDIEVITDFTVTGDRLTVKGLFKNGYTGGNANVRVLSLNGVDRALIEGCRFITKVTTAVIGFVTTACTAINIKDCVFLVDSTTNLSKNVVDTITGSTWSIHNVFDLGAGSGFSGGSGAAVAGDDMSSVSSSIVSVGVVAASAATSAALSTLTSSAGSTVTSNTTVFSTLASKIDSVGVVAAS